jgi:tRNA-splicing endonuclease subunit Sen2
MNSVPAQAINEYLAEDFDAKFVQRFYKPPVEPLELLALPNSIRTHLAVVKELPESLDRSADLEVEVRMNGHVEAADGIGIVPEHKMNGREATETNGLGIHEPEKIDELEIVGGSDTNDETNEGSVHSEETGDTSATPPNGSSIVNGALLTPKIKRRKSVRFSPTVEKNTFLQSEPPSPEHAANVTTTIEEEPLVIQDQEHIQLTLEEAFLELSLFSTQKHNHQSQPKISSPFAEEPHISPHKQIQLCLQMTHLWSITLYITTSALSVG